MVKKRHCNVQRLDSKIMENFGGLENNTSCDLFRCSHICIKKKTNHNNNDNNKKKYAKKRGEKVSAQKLFLI